MKTAFVSGLLFASLTPLVATDDSAEADKLATTCPNVLVHEPLLLYEVRGSTLAAQIDRTLTVYADGSIRLAAAAVEGPGKCMSLQVDPEAAAALHTALVRAGSLALCDDTRNVTDVPLHTLTVLGKTQTTRAHTFSYWIGDESYESVDLALEQFILEQFPGF